MTAAAAINAGVIAQSRVVEDRLFEGMVAAILSALWQDRAPEDVDLAGLGFQPDQIARHRDAATREARNRHALARERDSRNRPAWPRAS